MATFVYIKKDLSEEYKPQLIEKQFPEYTNEDLLLEYIENSNKLHDSSVKDNTPNKTSSSYNFQYTVPPIYKNEANSTDDDEIDRLSWQFKLLKKQYAKNIYIPPIEELSTKDEIKRTIRNILREANLNKRNDRIKSFLHFLLVGIEYVGTQYLGLPLSEFTTDQINKSSSIYDDILLEISDKSYLNWTDTSSPELRLFTTLIEQIGRHLFINNRSKVFSYMTLPNASSDEYTMKGP